jgi:hypothetical protein
MAWENRGARQYWYRSIRSHDGGVRKEYLGRGPAAVAAAKRQAEAQVKRQADADAAAAMAAESEPLDRLAVDLDAGVEALVEASLRVEGFHDHKGTWRKRRDLKRKTTPIR